MNQLLAGVIAQSGVNIGEQIPFGDSSLTEKYPTVSVLISIIVSNAITVIGIILLGILIFQGLMFIISAGSGDSKKSEQIQKSLTNALIGFAIVFLAYFVIQIIEVITGLNIFNPGRL